MGNFKEEVKGVVISEEARKNLTPEQLALLEKYLKILREHEFEDVKLVNPDKFDAKGMKPVDQKGPVRWKVIDDPKLTKK